MYNAATRRFSEALALATGEAGYEAGAIYLFGYAAEMLLKTAYCQFAGLPRLSPIYQSVSMNFRLYQRSVRGQAQNLHALTDLAHFLVDTRVIGSQPMSPAIAGSLRLHTSIIEQHWQVEMRYYDFDATLDEANEVVTSVEWLFENYEDLWN